MQTVFTAVTKSLLVCRTVSIKDSGIVKQDRITCITIVNILKLICKLYLGTNILEQNMQ